MCCRAHNMLINTKTIYIYIAIIYDVELSLWPFFVINMFMAMRVL